MLRLRGQICVSSKRHSHNRLLLLYSTKHKNFKKGPSRETAALVLPGCENIVRSKSVRRMESHTTGLAWYIYWRPHQNRCRVASFPLHKKGGLNIYLFCSVKKPSAKNTMNKLVVSVNLKYYKCKTCFYYISELAIEKL